MIDIPDDYIIACMERTGWPPWMLKYLMEPENDEDDFSDDEIEDEDD